MENKFEIRIYTLNGVWMADMNRADQATLIRSAFHTTQLPTAYTEKADALVVQQAIARLNPNHTVIVEGTFLPNITL